MRLTRPNKSLILTALLIAMVVFSGCRRTFKVATDVCASVANPVQVETLSPIKVETAPLQVSGKLVPEKKASLTEVSVRGSSSAPGQRIVIVDIDGLLVNENQGSPLTINENPVALFREKLEHISRDPLVKAVVLRINSPGGGVTASDIMRRELEEFSNETQIPIVASVMDVGAGGAYYVATAANEIYAHPTSIIGGIGVLLNLYKLELETFNVISVAVKAGKKVDMGTPMREMPDDVREILQGIANDFHERFIELVRASRTGIDDGEDMFDGRVCTATTAKQKGFVDEIGYLDDAIGRAEVLGGCKGAAVVLLDRNTDDVKTALDVLGTTSQSLNLLGSIPGLDRSKLPAFLYIWQPDPSLTAKIGG